MKSSDPRLMPGALGVLGQGNWKHSMKGKVVLVCDSWYEEEREFQNRVSFIMDDGQLFTDSYLEPCDRLFKL